MTILQATTIVEDAPAPPATLDPSLRIEAATPPPQGGIVLLAVALALALHAGLVALAVLGDRLDRSNVEDTKAIPVELVPSVPKPKPKIDWPEPPKDIAKPDKQPKPKPPEKSEPQPPKQEAPKQDAPKQDAPQEKPAQVKPPPAQQKPEATKQSPPPAKPAPAAEKPAAPDGARPPQPPEAQPTPAPPPAPPPGDPHPEAAAKPAPAALVQPPSPPLSRMDQIYAPMAMDLPMGTFRQRALTAAGQKEADAYKAEVFALLEQAKEIPQSARARGAKGVTIVGFTIDLSGNLVSASILHSSGDPELDAAALDTVKRAAPFPLPPPEAQRSFTPALVFGEE